jgi:hypothetical protein
MRMRREVYPWLFVIALGAGGACAGPTTFGADDASCKTAARCSEGSRCLSGTCVPPARAPRTWAIEILPWPDAPEPEGGDPALVPAPLTEIPAWTSGEDDGDLVSVGVATLPITFMYGSAAAPAPAKANVLLTVPSSIPGRPDLTFETNDVREGRALLTVPADLAGRSGVLHLTPWPTEGGSPPYAFPVSSLDEGRLEIAVGNSVSLRGRLHSAFDTPFPPGRFVAQAFVGETLVSNSVTVDADGRFALLVPAAVTDPVALALLPTNGNTDPRFLSAPVTLPATSLDITLPSYVATPNHFRLPLTNNRGELVEPGFPVHAKAVLASDESGTTTFVQDTVSLDGASANFALLPGTQSGALHYSFEINPAVTSEFRTTCTTATLSAGSTDPLHPTELAPATIEGRFGVFGTVLTATGSTDSNVGRVPNVVVTATLKAPQDNCPTRVRTVSTTTDIAGYFELFLDPGTYQLDYDPPVNAPVPRWTQPSLDVSGFLSFEVHLPEAGFVTGLVYGPRGTTLPWATIRLYEVRCSAGQDCSDPSLTALLSGQAQADANGHFVVVVSKQ